MKLFLTGKARVLALCVLCGVIGLGVGAAIASQPQMDAALSALRSAQGELQKVTLNKGGHAQKARQLVGQAIDQVEQGIAYGRAQGL